MSDLPDFIKKFSVISLFAATIFMSALSYAQCENIGTNGLIAHWEFNETSGTFADSAGSNTGTQTGGVEYASSGVIDFSVGFDGVDDNIYAGTNALISVSSPFTISVWIFKTPGATSWHNILNIPFNGSDSLELIVTDSTDFEPLAWGSFDDATFDVMRKSAASGDHSDYDNVWKHVVLTYDGVSGTGLSSFKLYEDTVLQSTELVSNSFTNSGNRIDIGTAFGTNNHWDGRIDDLRIYNRVLSAEEIGGIYSLRSNATPSEGEIVFNTKYDVMQYCDGTDWVNMGVGSYNPEGVYFDGVNDYLARGADLTGLVDSNLITGSIWFRRNGALGVSQNLYTNSNNRIQIRFPTNNEIRIEGEDDLNTSILQVDTVSTITDFNWHHLVFSFDLTDTNKRHVYIDDTSDISVNIYNTTGGPIDFTRSNHGIGASGTGGLPFTGDLADIWIDFGTYIDLSVEANRRKFISDSGLPMYLGPDGSIPTGGSPELFLSGDTTDWHTNKGTGGGFTENGAIEYSSSQPGTCAPESGTLTSLASQTSLNYGTYIYGDTEYVYLADNNSGLHAYSFDGVAFSSAGSTPAEKTQWVWTDNEYIYTARGNSTDIKAWSFNGSTFTELDAFDTTNSADVVWGDGEYIYFNDGADLHAVTFDGTNFSASLASITIGVSPPGYYGIWGDGDYIYVARNTDGLRALAFNGISFTSAATFNPPSGSTNGVWGDGDYIYSADGNAGLRAYSFNGNAFTELDRLDIGGSADNIHYDGEYIWVAHGAATGVANYTFDGSTLVNVDSDVTAGNGTGVWSNGTHLFVSDGAQGIIAYGGSKSCNCGPVRSGMAKAGLMSYSFDFNVMQYCNGDEWVAMGPIGGTPAVATGCYLLDSTSGTTAVNVCDANPGANGTLTNFATTPGWDTTGGVVDGTLSFVGDDDYIDLTATNAGGYLQNVAGAAVSMWIKPSTIDTGSDPFQGNSLVSFSAGAAATNSRFALAIGNSDEISVGGRAADGESFHDLDSTSSPIQVRAWQHVVGMIDYPKDIMKIYVNGELVASGKTTDPGPFAATTSNTGSTNAAIGSEDDGGSDYYAGEMDEVRVYNRILTEREIQQLYYFGLSRGLGDVDNACASPARPEGVMLYNSDNNVMQYCNGEEWIRIGQ